MISGIDKQGCFPHRKLLFRVLRKMHIRIIRLGYKSFKQMLRNINCNDKIYIDLAFSSNEYFEVKDI